MAFWALHGGENESSKETVTVEDLLGCHSTEGADELPTLDRLLEADGLLHELRLQNPLLLSFLTKQHVMQELIDRSFPRGDRPMSLFGLVHFVNGNGGGDADEDDDGYDDEGKKQQPGEQTSSVCFEMLSSESSLICEALLQDEHFQRIIIDVLTRPNVDSVATGRLCRILMNLLNYNEMKLKELLERHRFGTVIVSHLGNFALMDCLAKSKIVSLLDENRCVELMEKIVDRWTANPELAHSSADLFVTLGRRVNAAAAVPCLVRLISDELGSGGGGAGGERLPVREATVRAVIALCDQFLPRPFVALEMHAIGRQIMLAEEDTMADTASPQHVDQDCGNDVVRPIIDALSEHSRSIESYFKTAEGGPFGQLRYLLLCLFMRLIAITAAAAAAVATAAPDGDEHNEGDQLRPTAEWLKKAILDYVVPGVLVKWPMNNHAHQAMLGVANMAVEAGLFTDSDRECLARRCIESWYELEQAQTLCPGGWSHWYKLVRRLVPLETPLPAMKHTLARNAFLWIEQRELENRLRYQQFAPAVDVVFRDQFGVVPCWQEDDDEAAWLTCKEEQVKSPPAQGGHDEFQSLWWCSPEDMTAFPDSPAKDDDLGPESPVAAAGGGEESP